MIRPPRRSVTRFFIPLIDVLILLFAIFLMMPMVQEEAAGAGGDARLTAGQADQLRQENNRLLERIVELEKTRESDPQLRARIEQLERDLARPIEKKVLVRTLYFNSEGAAFEYVNARNERVPLNNDADAIELIEQVRQQAARENREPLFVYNTQGNRRRAFRGEIEKCLRLFQGRAPLVAPDMLPEAKGTEERQ